MTDDTMPLQEKLIAIDANIRELWDAMGEDDQKRLKTEFFILNRYISNATGASREMQEYFVLTINERFNKHFFSLQKHPKLLWLLLCSCNFKQRKFFHQWIGYKKKTGKSDNKKIKFLLDLYPNKKEKEIEMIAERITDKELKCLAKELGWSDSEIKKLK